MAGTGTYDDPFRQSYDYDAYYAIRALPESYVRVGTTFSIPHRFYNLLITTTYYEITSISGPGSWTYTTQSTAAGDLHDWTGTATTPGRVTISFRYKTTTGREQTYTSYFDVVERYDATWLNYDGSVLSTTINVVPGDTPAYKGATPQREGNTEEGTFYLYTFTGWLPTVGPIYSNVTYTAQYRADAQRDVLFQEDCPYVIVFDPAGGGLQSPSWYNLHNKPLPSASVGSIAFDANKNYWVWYYDDNTSRAATSVSVTFTNLPYSPTTGLVPPNSIRYATAWSMVAPYETTTISGGICTFTLTLKRPSLDNICQKTAYPEWVPARTNQQRAFITSPGYGSIDLGNIQSINEVYSSRVMQIPIVVYGFRNAFCMDTGVTKQIELQYIRTQPNTPNDESGDSREWTNARWLNALKTAMDRWQMRTNGNRLYILRPESERLHEGDDIPGDPMNTYFDEINGLNCYITDVPITYGNVPQILQGKLSLAVGTLYPKQRELSQRNITYYNGSSGTSSLTETLFTAGRWLSLPSPNILWPPLNQQGTIYGDWSWTDNQGNTISAAPGYVVDLDTVPNPTFTADHIYDGELVIYYDNVPGAGKQLTIKKATASQNILIFAACVGGGGGGGCGRIAVYRKDIFSGNKFYVTGGGGGGSGGYNSQIAELPGAKDQLFTISYTVGAGGAGGANHDNEYHKGDNGGSSSVYVASAINITGGGGSGGDGGSDDWIDNDNYVGLGGQGGTGLFKGNGGDGGQRGHDAKSGSPPMPADSNFYSGGGGAAYPNEYTSTLYSDVAPSSGGTGHAITGVDVGGGGGGAVWYESTPPGDYPNAGRGGDGAYVQSPAGDGILGGGGGGGGGAKLVSSNSIGEKTYRVYPGGKGGDGYVILRIAGATIVT